MDLREEIQQVQSYYVMESSKFVKQIIERAIFGTN